MRCQNLLRSWNPKDFSCPMSMPVQVKVVHYGLSRRSNLAPASSLRRKSREMNLMQLLLRHPFLLSQQRTSMISFSSKTVLVRQSRSHRQLLHRNINQTPQKSRSNKSLPQFTIVLLASVGQPLDPHQHTCCISLDTTANYPISAQGVRLASANPPACVREERARSV